MERKIFKYELEIMDSQLLMIPSGAEILTVQTQSELPKLWALCDPEQIKEARTICIFGTGNPIPEGNFKYISTFQLMGGIAVFHVFENINP